MQKIKVVTFNGALKLLNISNMTFYKNYRNHVHPCGTQKKANLYKVDDLLNRKEQIEKEKMFHSKFEIIE